jgi:phage repressor protein C with HTH and peptisase S24 domain
LVIYLFGKLPDHAMMTREEIRRENARELARSVGGQTEFGRLLEMEGSQVSQLIGKSPKKNIGNSIARRIEVAFRKPEGWLDQNHGLFHDAPGEDAPARTTSDLPFVSQASRVLVDAPEADTIPVRRVALRLQAGFPGFDTDREFEDGGVVNLPRQFIEQNDLVPQCLLAIKVRGSSMEPMLFEDDTVVINIADTKPTNNDLFAINFNGMPIIKQLVREGREWWLHSFNRDPQYTKVACREGECIILGRVVHQGARSLIGRL